MWGSVKYCRIPLEIFTGKRQSVAHLQVFGSKCWAKIPTVHGVQVTGGSKLDPQSVECRLLGYASGNGNYKVQDVTSSRIYVSRDVVFEEGQPRRTSASVGEQISIFDADLPLANHVPDPDHDRATTDDHHADINIDQQNLNQTPVIPIAPCRSARALIPSKAGYNSREYQAREDTGCIEGQEWATDKG